MAEQNTSEAASFAQQVEDLHNSYRTTAAPLLGCDPVEVILGWKLTHVDGTTSRGTDHEFQWPLDPLGGPGTLVISERPDPKNAGSCPHWPGDGLCAVAMGHVREATSGTARFASGQGHVLAWAADDVLSTSPDEDGKLRVTRVADLGVFDVLETIRVGLAPDLGGANLGGANLRDAYLGGAYLRNAYLAGAYLGGANLRDANLRDANLGDANLRGANLRDAGLVDANLGGANLGGAYLRDAYLGGANLRGANLRGANLRDAYLRDARHDKRTAWPDGFDMGAVEVTA